MNEILLANQCEAQLLFFLSKTKKEKKNPSRCVSIFLSLTLSDSGLLSQKPQCPAEPL